MDFTTLSHRCTLFVSLLLLLLLRSNAQRIRFSKTGFHMDTAIVGQQVGLLCSTDEYLLNQDNVEIYFNDALLARYDQGTTAYYATDRPDGYYEIDIYQTESSSMIGVGLVIHKVHEEDDGIYLCRMTLAGQMQHSEPVRLNVRHIPMPTCLVPSVPGTSYNTDGRSGELITDESVNVTLVCHVHNEVNGVNVTLDWSRSDGALVVEHHVNGPTLEDGVSLSVSDRDDGVIYTCKARNSTFYGFTKYCTIKVLLSSNLIVSTESVSTEARVSPTTTTIEASPVKTLSDETVHTGDVYIETSTDFINISTTLQTAMSTGVKPSKEEQFPVRLIVGAGITLSVLCFATMFLIIVACIKKSLKRETVTPKFDDVEILYKDNTLKMKGFSFYNHRTLDLSSGML